MRARSCSANLPERQGGEAARAANDNKPNAKPVVRFAWDVYRAAARARWIGQVISVDAGEAIEAAAVERTSAS